MIPFIIRKHSSSFWLQFLKWKFIWTDGRFHDKDNYKISFWSKFNAQILWKKCGHRKLKFKKRQKKSWIQVTKKILDFDLNFCFRIYKCFFVHVMSKLELHFLIIGLCIMWICTGFTRCLLYRSCRRIHCKEGVSALRLLLACAWVAISPY